MTPPPLNRTGDDAEQVRSIARDEAQRESALHENRCLTDGPICGVWEEIGKMRNDIAAINKELDEGRGAAREAGRAAGLRSAIITSVIVVLAQIGLFVAARFWPAPAAAQVRVSQPQGGSP